MHTVVAEVPQDIAKFVSEGEEALRLTHKTIKGDPRFREVPLNKAIARLRELSNALFDLDPSLQKRQGFCVLV